MIRSKSSWGIICFLCQPSTYFCLSLTKSLTRFVPSAFVSYVEIAFILICLEKSATKLSNCSYNGFWYFELVEFRWGSIELLLFEVRRSTIRKELTKTIIAGDQHTLLRFTNFLYVTFPKWFCVPLPRPITTSLQVMLTIAWVPGGVGRVVTRLLYELIRSCNVPKLWAISASLCLLPMFAIDGFSWLKGNSLQDGSIRFPQLCCGVNSLLVESGDFFFLWRVVRLTWSNWWVIEKYQWHPDEVQTPSLTEKKLIFCARKFVRSSDNNIIFLLRSK